MKRVYTFSIPSTATLETDMPMPKDTSRELPKEIIELIRCANTLNDKDQNYLAPALDAVVEATARRRRILALVQDALGQLRLDMKYLMLDLEATRSERDLAMDGKMLTKEDEKRIRKVITSSVAEALKDVEDCDSIMKNILSLIDKKSKDIGKK